MIVLRGKYFMVSRLGNLDNEILEPVVPKSSLGYHGEKIGDTKTPRLVFYPSISHALLGMIGEDLTGMVLTVYIPQGLVYHSCYRPTIQECPIVGVTEETWILRPTRIRSVMKIRILRRKNSHSISIGPRGIKRELWEWEWIEDNAKEISTGKLFYGSKEDGLTEIQSPVQFYKTKEEAKKNGPYVYKLKKKIKVREDLMYYGKDPALIEEIK